MTCLNNMKVLNCEHRTIEQIDLSKTLNSVYTEKGDAGFTITFIDAINVLVTGGMYED
jgi:hypothetical protein